MTQQIDLGSSVKKKSLPLVGQDVMLDIDAELKNFEDAERETRQMLEVYREFAETVLAMPVMVGRKTDRERLPLDALAAFALGAAVAAKVIRHAENDGAQRGWNGSRLQYYGQDRYYGPGSWEPTPPYFYYPPDEPFAPNWRTWTLISVSQFRPVPPQLRL